MQRLFALHDQICPEPLTGTAKKTYDLVFIGAGKMVTAIVMGLIKNGTYAPSQMACTSAPDGSGEKLEKKTRITYCPNIEDLFPENNETNRDPIVFLGFKPQNLSEIDKKLKVLTKNKLIVSIIAGSTIKSLCKSFPDCRNVVRSMPNIAGSINQGITGYASKYLLDAQENAAVEGILKGFGQIVKMEEKDLNAVTGLSGSGPAYVFEFIAALRDGGVDQGLDKEVAEQLALETVFGSSMMVKQLNIPADNLTKLVTSKGGTTFAGLEIFKKYDFKKIMSETVAAATKRADELGKMSEQ